MDNPSRALPRRFWPRLSIRGLMILVLVLGGGIGWVAQRAKIQRDAVRGISAAGGVRYNWQYVSEKYDPKASPPGPKWLRDIVGPDLLDTVVLANLQGPNADDRVMSHVGALPGVERFNLQGKTSPSLTAAGMARIGQLPRLQQFWVQGMTDPSGFLPYLFDKPRLRSIWLQAAAVTDGDLARLARLTRLEELLLNGRNVTDAGFAHLASLKSLRWLELPGCHVGDLSALSGLKDLERINLHTRVSPRHDQSTPVDLGPLHNLSKLTDLSLSPHPVDDAGLAQIKDLPQLQCLDVAGLGITEAGLAFIGGLSRRRTRTRRPSIRCSNSPRGSTPACEEIMKKSTGVLTGDSIATDRTGAGCRWKGSIREDLIGLRPSFGKSPRRDRRSRDRAAEFDREAEPEALHILIFGDSGASRSQSES
jgi:hypothetical protein